MGRSWLINSRGLAQKVRNASSPAENRIQDCGATRECPNCHHLIDNSDVSPEWPGFPAGVKFEPSDVELLEHLAAKCGEGNSEPHMFLDEFIPTLEGDEGICYTHPENLPGIKKDGSSGHFFYRTKKAYATGTRKRRKISNETSLVMEHVRWHKTGKTKAVMENGVQKGCKKVMVLYSTKKGEKPGKTNWVMHQYHLGIDEDEKEGGYVVSKIYYQQQQQKQTTDNAGESDIPQAIPTTPMTAIPNPPRAAGETPLSCDDYNAALSPPAEEVEGGKKERYGSLWSDVQVKCEEYPGCLAGESQAAADATDIDDFLLCDEIVGSFDFNNLPSNHATSANFNPMPQEANNTSSSTNIADLVNLELDSAPEFSLQDLPFGSQDSISSWLDRL
ncbi:PREDICTED: NAC domain-containing protein 8-like [Ipomoea nil]|uniref:NAC domain-containing protein 8-like n=1 Tax=Ipomoea nil TaxID=35883 RepID=UPI0009014FEC|nr:PREDICTED: NAC domain-containing protein 8-like [Ipomoea nil]